MAKKYLVLICIVTSVALLLVAVSLYPGGSLLDRSSTGFDWSKNFISNLFGRNAINGLGNPSGIWAIIGMAFFSIGEGEPQLQALSLNPKSPTPNLLVPRFFRMCSGYVPPH